MIIRRTKQLQEITQISSTSQDLCNDCCDDPQIMMTSKKASRRKGAATIALIFCDKCKTELLEISIR